MNTSWLNTFTDTVVEAVCPAADVTVTVTVEPCIAELEDAFSFPPTMLTERPVTSVDAVMTLDDPPDTVKAPVDEGVPAMTFRTLSPEMARVSSTSRVTCTVLD